MVSQRLQPISSDCGTTWSSDGSRTGPVFHLRRTALSGRGGGGPVALIPGASTCSIRGHPATRLPVKGGYPLRQSGRTLRLRVFAERRTWAFNQTSIRFDHSSGRRAMVASCSSYHPVGGLRDIAPTLFIGRSSWPPLSLVDLRSRDAHQGKQVASVAVRS